MTSNINYHLISTYNGLLLDGSISMINKNKNYSHDDIKNLNREVMVLANMIAKNISLTKLAELLDPANGILDSKSKSFIFIESTLNEIFVNQNKLVIGNSPSKIPLDIFNKLVDMLSIFVKENN